MDNAILLGGGGFVIVVAMILCSVPVGAAMGLVGLGGAVMIIGLTGATSIVATTVSENLMNYTISILPLFILMGNLASEAGLSTRLYRSMRTLLGHHDGGLALATVGGCAGFGMVSGSSLATAATMGRIAIPEMKAANYPLSFAAGTVAAGGALGILIPPSTILVFYAFLAGQSIRDLMLATLFPILVAIVLYLLAVWLSVRLGWEKAPRQARAPGRERLRALIDILPIMAVFAVIMGGLYTGFFTANETAAVGAGIVLIYGLAARQLGLAQLIRAAKMTAMNCAALYAIIFGASIFNFFLTLTGFPFVLTGMLGTLTHNPLLLLLVMTLVYLLLGAFMDALAMLLLTVPLFAPIAQAAGIDLLWFGIYVVIMVEVSMVTPPVGMNLFVIKASHPELRMPDVWKGIVPFLGADLLRLIALIAVPAMATWLPTVAR